MTAAAPSGAPSAGADLLSVVDLSCEIQTAAGPVRPSQELLGAARQEIGTRCGLIDSSAWSFLWVVDFPMCEKTDEGGWTAIHHPSNSALKYRPRTSDSAE